MGQNESDGEVFGFLAAEDYFYSLNACFNQYLTASKTGKPIEPRDVFFLVTGLNHLREWIAPNFNDEQSGMSKECYDKAVRSGGGGMSAEVLFFVGIYHECEEFKLLKKTANTIKHRSLRKGSLKAEAEFSDEPDIFAQDDVFALNDIMKGFPTSYFINGRRLEDILKAVIGYYEQHWFKDSKSRRGNR